MLKATLLSAALLLASAPHLAAQQQKGSIKGTVSDQLSGLVTHARVVLNDDRAFTTSITTNSAGAFEFKNLKPGLYQVRVDAPGFVVYEDKQVTVTARQATHLNIQLSVELEEQQVTVDNRSVSTDSDNNA